MNLFLILFSAFRILFHSPDYTLLFDSQKRLCKLVPDSKAAIEFYIRSDHTTPFSGYVLGNKIFLIALRVDTSSDHMALNPGWWVQVYNLNGIFDTSLIYTPKIALKNGYAFLKPFSILFKNSIYVTFNISDCVYKITANNVIKVREPKCKLLPEVRKMPEHYGIFPSRGIPEDYPRVIGFVLSKNNLYVKVFDGKKERLFRID